MKKFTVTFFERYQSGTLQPAVSKEVIAASFRANGMNGITFFSEDGTAISYHSNVDTVQLDG